jgi:hypothetical protein
VNDIFAKLRGDQCNLPNYKRKRKYKANLYETD